MDIFKKYKFNFAAVSLIIILILAVYLPVLKYDFLMLDDNLLITNKFETLANLSNIPSYFTKTVYDVKNDNYYRPLLNVSFALDAFIMKGDPFIYHLTNIILHILCCICLFILLLMLGFDKNLSLLSMLVFAVHPAFAHVAAWVPGRNETILAFFGAMSCISLLLYVQNKKLIFFVFFSLFYLLALFSKETAVALFAIYFMLLYVFRRDSLNRRLAAKIFAAGFLSTIVYLAARYVVLKGNVLGVKTVFSLDTVFNATLAVGKYLEYFLAPVNIHILSPLSELKYTFFLALVLFFIFIILSLYLKNTRKQVIIFGVLWFFIFLIPTYAIPVNYSNSQRLYFISFGLIIAFIETAAALIKSYPVTKKYIYAALICVIVLFGIFTRFGLPKYENKYIFWTYAVSETPKSPLARMALGVCLMESGNFEEAEKELLKAV